MSTIPLSFEVHTKNWPRIYLQLLKFNFELYFWRFGGGGGAKLQKNSRSQ